MERILQMFPALKSYFLSIKEPPQILQLFFSDEFSELQFLFIQSLMSIFFDKMKASERQENSVLEILSIIQDISTSMQNRYDSKFLPLIVKSQLKLRNEGEDKACDKFVESALLVYQRKEAYLAKWTESLLELQVFEWLDFKPEKDLKYQSVEETVLFLVTKNFEIDENKLFHPVMNLNNFLKGKSNNVEYFEKSCNSKICDFFAANKNIDSYSEVLKIAEYFFAIPGHNANCERIFTFSSEKVLDLCKMGPPPPFLSNAHVLRPSEPEKMVFANVSVCVSVCLSVCRF